MSMVDYEILGKHPPADALSVDAYLYWQKHPSTKDLRLFPKIKYEPFQDKEDVQKAMADRLRWLAKQLQVHPNEIYGTWLNDKSIVEELLFLKELSPADFQDESRVLGMQMLKDEAGIAPYLLQLQKEYRYRMKHFDRDVVVIGPTAGGEVEAVATTRANPVVFCGDGFAAALCELRLLHDRIHFDIVTEEELSRRKNFTRHVIVTPYISDADRYVTLAYNCLGSHGWIYCPVTSYRIVEMARSLGLMTCKVLGEYVAVFFKHIGLPLTVGL